MYAKRLSIYDFKCFKKAVLELQYPGRPQPGLKSAPLDIQNVNLIVGDNGGGKSSVLRAIAIAALAPALLESGFVPYRLVRRPDAKEALLKLDCQLDPSDPTKDDRETIELLARIQRREGRGSLDRLHLESTPGSPIERLLFDDFSTAFFVVGYGATRRAESGEYVESSHRRSRGLRYQRIAGLFEDHVALRPMQTWLPRIKDKRRRSEVIDAINAILPSQVVFAGKFDESEDQYLFDFEGHPTPFASLSDGFKAFVSWVSDLIGHLCDVVSSQVPLNSIPGIVLLDEIDLHLHPAWQRTVLSSLAAVFPKLQFVMTSHSPLVASTLRKENIFVTTVDETGYPAVTQIEESVHGRGADQLLLSSYFGLQTTLPPSLEAAGQTLFARAAEGDTEAALAFVKQLTSPTDASSELAPEVVEALARPAPQSKRTKRKK